MDTQINSHIVQKKLRRRRRPSKQKRRIKFLGKKFAFSKLLRARKIIGVILVLIASYFTLNFFLEKTVDRLLPLAKVKLEQAGFVVGHLGYGKISATIIGVVFSDFTFYGEINRENGKASTMRINIPKLKVDVSKITSIAVQASDVTLTAENTLESKMPQSQEARLRSFQITSEIDLFSPIKGITSIVDELKNLTVDGESDLPISLDGVILLRLDDTPNLIKVSSSVMENKYRIVLDENDLLKLSPLFEDDLTASEVSVIAKYPLKTPRLLQIKNYARNQAKKIHSADNEIPEDAYRHVLWSYLLTKAFDATFAEEVTTAHEIDAKNNSEEAYEMDINNNQIGRQYAQDGISEKEIANRIKNDPKVIAEPGGKVSYSF